jgi:fucose-1-phosphate guanylyltransferase
MMIFLLLFKGNGGSTMHAMHVLEQQYGWEVLRQKRILLIHAGGYSQRTPTTSCLGKIATSIPKGVIEKKKPHD